MSSRVRLDAIMSERRRRDVLARLGEAVFELAARGELGDVAEHPDLAELLAELASLDEAAGEAYQDEAYPDDDAREPVSSAEWRAPRPHGGAEELRVWRPVMPRTHGADSADDGDGEDPDQDTREHGQPASHRTGSRARAPEPEGAYISTPVRSASTSKPKEPSTTERHDQPGAEQHRAGGRRGSGSQRGGIVFVSDDAGPGGGDEEDLSEYMHEDDLPRRGSDPGSSRGK